MKKYIKTISIVTVILVTFTIYYIKNDVITGVNPSFAIEKINGDMAIEDKVLFTGTVYDDEGIYDESFTWRDGKTVYANELSILQQLSEGTDSMKLKQYEKDYRSFMRGTVRDEAYFYEDDELLAYAGTPYSFFDFTVVDFDIKLLNKKTNDVTKFTLPIPEQGKYWHVSVSDVYYEDGKIYATTVNEQNTDDDTNHTVVVVHVFDIETQSLLGHKTVAEYKEKERYDGYSILETVVDEKTPGLVYVVQSDYSYEDGLNDTSEMDFAKQDIQVEKVMKLDVIGQKATEIEMPKKLLQGNVMFSHDKFLYSNEIDPQKITLHRLHVDTKEIESLDIPLSYTSDAWSIYGSTMDIQEELLYFTVDYLEKLEKAPLLAVDLKDFTLVYEGEIIPEMNEGIQAGTKQVYFEQLKLVD